MKPGEKVVLEIGCGEKKMINGSIGLDIRQTVVTEVISDARHLPFRDNCFDHIFSSHVIEHFSHREVKQVLKEWMRVLKPDGIFELRCPDLQARCLLFFLHPNQRDIRNIYGDQDYSENYHMCGFSYGLLRRLLKEIGITQIKRVINGYHGIPFLPDCIHVRGSKLNK